MINTEQPLSIIDFCKKDLDLVECLQALEKLFVKDNLTSHIKASYESPDTGDVFELTFKKV